MRYVGLLAVVLFAVSLLAQGRYGTQGWWSPGQGGYFPWEEAYDNPDGQVGIVSRDGSVRTEDHPFFEPLGTNGRACVSCHQPSSAMSVSAASLRERWQATQGNDPVFAAIDGSNCPDLPQNTPKAHSLLLDKGLFRIFLPWPPKTKPEFRIEIVEDPTGCNKNNGFISVYRRPRMAANLEYVLAGPQGTSFMADGREPSLRSQAIGAIMGHQEATRHPDEDQLARIVAFERQVFAAQVSDVRAGLLGGALLLGPANLAGGKAGRFADAPRLAAWEGGGPGSQSEFRASVARGSEIFFRRRFRLRESGGEGTCGSCHRAETTRWMDIGTTHQRVAGLPVFRITCDASAAPHPVLGRVIYTQDPGRALVSGKCADAGAIVIQQLRGLAARAPYFANGSAATLGDVVDYYDRYFHIGYTDQEKQHLVSFLGVL